MNYTKFLENYFVDNNIMCEGKDGNKFELAVSKVIEDGDSIFLLGKDVANNESRFIEVDKFALGEMMDKAN